MDPRVPISTDNIYKFQATFGLVLIITGFVLLVVNGQYSNKIIFSTAEEWMNLDLSSQQAEQREKLYQRKIDIAKSNRFFFNLAIGALLALGCTVAGSGFWKWSKQLQPLYDDILRLEKEKLELEIAALQNQAGSDKPDTGENSTAS